MEKSTKDIVKHLRIASNHLLGACRCATSIEWDVRLVSWYYCQTSISICLGTYGVQLSDAFKKWANSLEQEEKLQ